jgi:hypothetical protein
MKRADADLTFAFLCRYVKGSDKALNLPDIVGRISDYDRISSRIRY